ncbi:GNAT domain [Sesbania bispinosa]|nr:GNAT domain [Sesbania bispinosa]
MTDELRSQGMFGKQEDGGREAQIEEGAGNENKGDNGGSDKMREKGEGPNGHGLSGRKIIRKQLIDAGWIVGCLFTYQNDYNQEVYVNLDGSRAFTSIIKAYHTLRKHYKDGNGEGKFYEQGFQLIPISEMTINISREKESINEGEFEHIGEKVATTVDGVNRKVNKETLGSGTTGNKQKKGKTRRKWPLVEEGEDDGTTPYKVSNQKQKNTKTKRRRQAPLVYNYEIDSDASSEEDLYEPYKGKRTVFSWMIDLGTFQENSKMLPSGVWLCTYCRCKFCGLLGKSTNVVETTRVERMEVLNHKSCAEANIVDFKDAFLCGNRSCQELSERLEMLLGFKHEMEDGFSWSFIRRSNINYHDNQIKPQVVECNSKLAIALSIFDECFEPSIDYKCKINMMQSMIYGCGSNFARVDCKGFFTAILEKGDEMISVATIRIHGNQVAEMPFVGTREMYRKQGMCRRLLNAIEMGLSFLNLELLVIPANSSTVETWTSGLGFEPLESESKEIMKNQNLLHFTSSVLLQKRIPKYTFSDQDMSSKQGQLSFLTRAKLCFGCGSSFTVLLLEEYGDEK